MALRIAGCLMTLAWLPCMAATAMAATAPSAPPPSFAALRQQAETGDAAAEVALGRRLLDRGTDADKAASVTWFGKAAIQGDTDGQWMLGSAYMAGDGVARDPQTGLQWMRRSLADGSPDHMSIYGMTVLMAHFMAGGRSDGLAWLRRGAEAGSAKGMLGLAMARMTGRFGLPQDKAAAERWFLKAAQKGDVSAQRSLGQIYVAGALGRKDVPAGLRWLRAAARQGDAQAEGTLAYFLISGDKQVPKAPLEGVQWAQQAVAQHAATGYYALGCAYQYGAGEPADPARAWFNFAVSQRLDHGHQLTHVADHMSDVATQLSSGDLQQLRQQAAAVEVPDTRHRG